VADQQQEQGAAAIDAGMATAEAEAAVCRIVAASGGQLVNEPLRPASTGVGERAAAGPGLVAARRLELAARLVTAGYVQAARAERMSWHEIGAWLGMGPGAAEDGVSVAEPPTGSPPGTAARTAGGRGFLVDLPGLRAAHHRPRPGDRRPPLRTPSTGTGRTARSWPPRWQPGMTTGPRTADLAPASPWLPGPQEAAMTGAEHCQAAGRDLRAARAVPARLTRAGRPGRQRCRARPAGRHGYGVAALLRRSLSAEEAGEAALSPAAGDPCTIQGHAEDGDS
jgi:hypothetical protein